MNKRKLFIAGNWKMHRAPDGAFDEVSPYKEHATVDVAIFPTFLDLKQCVQSGIPTGPQYGHTEGHGAHTGDVSHAMAKDVGCTYALCGHSDRRGEHNETNDQVAEQAAAAIEVGLMPVVCIGETEAEKDAGKGEEVVKAQLQAILDGVNGDFILAYEPVWAISRGDPNKPAATPEDAQSMHAFIRSLLPEDKKEVRILYGGSMKPENADELLAQPDIDGGLVGGASLKPDKFAAIIDSAEKLSG